jgi:hypothetical protein
MIHRRIAREIVTQGTQMEFSQPTASPLMSQQTKEKKMQLLTVGIQSLDRRDGRREEVRGVREEAKASALRERLG